MSKMARIEIALPRDQRGRKGWWKVVTGVDRTKARRGGWSLVGDFLGDGEYELPVGSVLVCGRQEGNNRKMASVFIVKKEGLEQVRSEKANSMHEFDLSNQVLTLHDVLEPMLGVDPNPLAHVSTTDIIQEMRRRGYKVMLQG